MRGVFFVCVCVSMCVCVYVCAIVERRRGGVTFVTTRVAFAVASEALCLFYIRSIG